MATRIKRKVCILGSTGSVGKNALEIVRQQPDRFEIVGLACGSSVDHLLAQIEEFQPSFVSLGSEKLAGEIREKLPRGVEIFYGSMGHRDLVEQCRADVVMASMSGTHGLLATLQAIRQNVSVLGIANKEILVMAGAYINEALEESQTKLVPVDSEHSAIFQALMGNSRAEVSRIILTASGGPFRSLDKSAFSKITKAQALQHPNWVMGSKITIDSATMMNKGLEYIEAIRLFQLRPEQIEIVVHPQSIIHSMVEYQDHSVMAQLGISDMRIPISLALAYPHRLSIDLGQKINFASIAQLNFEKPDYERFPCLSLAIEAQKLGDQGPVILNASNEIAVEAFLNDQISFVEIPQLIENALQYFADRKADSLDSVLVLDEEVRSWSIQMVDNSLNSEWGNKHHELVN
ncbi:MAG: 1-deoxy-D-xylulose-5-phosphate reductoisomerase [Deltaproteobacteria bacterium CG11_big_fil_rev_8_21_14_0_20_45_16]|nr:MAG: 1-deoxy-D-xylulose-5-phosphate reductoisomerase [Deltaproteobacteria bacterium CG11_big_fil_rev_8_21_14_0_20_45_16]